MTPNWAQASIELVLVELCFSVMAADHNIAACLPWQQRALKYCHTNHNLCDRSNCCGISCVVQSRQTDSACTDAVLVISFVRHQSRKIQIGCPRNLLPIADLSAVEFSAFYSNTTRSESIS